MLGGGWNFDIFSPVLGGLGVALKIAARGLIPLLLSFDIFLKITSNFLYFAVQQSPFVFGLIFLLI